MGNHVFKQLLNDSRNLTDLNFCPTRRILQIQKTLENNSRPVDYRCKTIFLNQNLVRNPKKKDRISHLHEKMSIFPKL